MTGSTDGRGPPDPARPYEPTLTSQPGQPAPESDTDRTRTVTGAGVAVSPAPPPPRANPDAGEGVSPGIAGDPQQVIRHGPGVPAPGPAGQVAPTAEQV